MDVVHRAMVEAELNHLMEKRSPREMDRDERDELWKASVAVYNARRREENRLAWCENRLAWCEYFSRLAGSLRARAEEYDQRVAQLEDRGEGSLLD